MTTALDDRRRPKFGLTHRLVLAREVAGLEQIDLAKVLDVSRATISNYERGVGKKGMSRLQVNAWAVACDVDVEWLKTGEGSSTPSDPQGVLSEELRFGNLQVTSIRTERSRHAKAA